MTRYLLTQTLLSSWIYMLDSSESGAETAEQEFMRKLNREPTEYTPKKQNGIDFENEVYKQIRGEPREPHAKWESGICAVATALKGAQTQVRASRNLQIGGKPFVVYGILDALRAGVIYDVKFSNTTFHSAELAGKYLNSPQHPAYFYIVPEAQEFRYIVSDGQDVYTERYTREITTPFETIAAEFIHYVEDAGLWETYAKKWKSKGDKTNG